MLFDVVPMDASHLMLSRPCEYDRKIGMMELKIFFYLKRMENIF